MQNKITCSVDDDDDILYDLRHVEAIPQHFLMMSIPLPLLLLAAQARVALGPVSLDGIVYGFSSCTRSFLILVCVLFRSVRIWQALIYRLVR
jgi:hypothetical protein